MKTKYAIPRNVSTGFKLWFFRLGDVATIIVSVLIYAKIMYSVDMSYNTRLVIGVPIVTYGFYAALRGDEAGVLQIAKNAIYFFRRSHRYIYRSTGHYDVMQSGGQTDET